MIKRVGNFLLKVILIIIQLYQYTFSLLIGKNCRFFPTCSNYAKEALITYKIYGFKLILIRILKCNAYHSGGYDPVPKKIKKF